MRDHIFSERYSLPRDKKISYLRVKSPLVAAVEIWAKARTCVVRFVAIALTFVVISCHTPSTPSTCARTPSLPSNPTSLATRVTSRVNVAKESIYSRTLLINISASRATVTMLPLTMPLMVNIKRFTSPEACRPSTFVVKSPLATASVYQKKLCNQYIADLTTSLANYNSQLALLTGLAPMIKHLHQSYSRNAEMPNWTYCQIGGHNIDTIRKIQPCSRKREGFCLSPELAESPDFFGHPMRKDYHHQYAVPDQKLGQYLQTA